MRASSLGSNLVAGKLRWVVAAVVCWNSAVLTQDRPPITPFKGPTITPGDVESARLKANRCRSVSKVHIRNSHEEFAGQHVGFAYVGTDGEIGQPVFSLTGTDESLSQISIPLSDIESMTLLKTEEHWFRWFGPDRALLEVIVFPDISPSQLLKSRPTYSQLAASTKSVRLWVSLNDENKRDLTMVATQSVLLTYTRLFPVRDLEPNHKVIFEWPDDKDAPIWWATDTVVADAKYPHRIVEQLALESPTNLTATVTQRFALAASQIARNRLTEPELPLHFAPASLAYLLGKYIVTLRWNASVSVSVVGYNLYRLSPAGSWVKLNQSLVLGTVFEDESVEKGMTYRYAATAVGMQNRESSFSNVVAAVIPSS
jgi:hypothetical protein